jgi:hypothetical protein
MTFSVERQKSTEKGLGPTSSLLLYSTWPNVGEFRPWVYAYCETCDQEKISPDALVFVAQRNGEAFRCRDCGEAFARAAIWSPLWRC